MYMAGDSYYLNLLTKKETLSKKKKKKKKKKINKNTNI